MLMEEIRSPKIPILGMYGNTALIVFFLSYDRGVLLVVHAGYPVLLDVYVHAGYSTL